MNWRRRAIPREQGHIHHPARIKAFFTILTLIGCFSATTPTAAAEIPARGGYSSVLVGGDYQTEAEAMSGFQTVAGCANYSGGLTICYDAYEVVSISPWSDFGDWAWSRIVETRIPVRSTTDGINWGINYQYTTGRIVLRYFCLAWTGYPQFLQSESTWQPGTGWPTCTDGLPTTPPPPPPPSACSGQGGYTINLQGPGGTAGALADVEPGASVNALSARVTCDGQPVSGKAIALTADVASLSGGHQHDQGRRPQHSGTVSFNGSDTTDANGDVFFTFTAPAPAGDHTITARCSDGSCGTDTRNVWVGVQGLVSLYETHLYRLVGSDGVHPNNHYLTIGATGSVVWLAELYRARFPNDPVLHLNDASLERGGLFDINYPARIQWWTPPHITHRRGIDVDVRANEFVHADAIPHRNYFGFEEIAIDVGCIADMHSEFTHNQHYHVTCG